MPVFYSPHAGFRLLIKPQYDRRHPTTGDVIEIDYAILAEFGQFGEEVTFMNPETGESSTGANIVGHYFDTDAEALNHGWSPEIHDLVVRRLRDAVRREPYRVQEIDRQIVKASAPWPTYDDCDAAQVLELAPALGLTGEALAYERENRQRQTVLDGLTALQEPARAEDAGEPAAEVAKAAEMLEKAKPGSRTITV